MAVIAMAPFAKNENGHKLRYRIHFGWGPGGRDCRSLILSGSLCARDNQACAPAVPILAMPLVAFTRHLKVANGMCFLILGETEHDR